MRKNHKRWVLLSMVGAYCLLENLYLETTTVAFVLVLYQPGK